MSSDLWTWIRFVCREYTTVYNITLEEEDSEVEGIGSDIATRRDPEQDFLSNIIDVLNDAHQTDFTTGR